MQHRGLTSRVTVGGVLAAAVIASGGCSRSTTVEGGLVIPPAHEVQLLVLGDAPTLKATNSGPAELGVAIEQPHISMSESVLGRGVTSYWGVTEGGKVFVRNRSAESVSFAYRVTGTSGFSTTLAPLSAP